MGTPYAYICFCLIGPQGANLPIRAADSGDRMAFPAPLAQGPSGEKDRVIRVREYGKYL